MPEKICPYCQEPFDANSLETESCRKTKCVKANQRAKKRAEAGVTEVKRGRPKSHVVALKERTKERIRKAQGPSSTPRAEPPQGTDVPPRGNLELEARINAIINHPQFEKELVMRGILLPEFQCDWHTFGGFDGLPEKYKNAIVATESKRLAMYRTATYETPTMRTEAIQSLKKLAEKLSLKNATAGLPPESLPEPLKAGMDKLRKHAQDLVTEGVVPQKTADAAVKLVLNTFTQLPVQHHGTENDLARSIISKVPATKLDPNSEEAKLARLQKSQLRTAKKKD